MMALDNYFLLTQQPSLDWDLHTFGAFGVGDFHDPMPLDLESPVSSEASTGYLQDAVAEWNDRCKRRRVESSPPHDPMGEELEDLLQGFWNPNWDEDPLGNLTSMVQDNNTVLDEHLNSSMLFKETSTQEKAAPQLQNELLLSPSSSHEDPSSKDLDEKDARPSHPCSTTLEALPPKEREERQENWRQQQQQKKKKKAMGLVYPFAVVKPGGLEGDMTLADINARLLMRPTRPVRHPVGEFACIPCADADGPGLSGKAIVGFTRIHTQGRGTITIIRTRG